MKRKAHWLLIVASAGILRLGLECFPEPDLVDSLSDIIQGLGINV